MSVPMVLLTIAAKLVADGLVTGIYEWQVAQAGYAFIEAGDALGSAERAAMRQLRVRDVLPPPSPPAAPDAGKPPAAGAAAAAADSVAPALQCVRCDGRELGVAVSASVSLATASDMLRHLCLHQLPVIDAAGGDGGLSAGAAPAAAVITRRDLNPEQVLEAARGGGAAAALRQRLRGAGGREPDV